MGYVPEGAEMACFWQTREGRKTRWEMIERIDVVGPPARDARLSESPLPPLSLHLFTAICFQADMEKCSSHQGIPVCHTCLSRSCKTKNLAPTAAMDDEMR